MTKITIKIAELSDSLNLLEESITAMETSPSLRPEALCRLDAFKLVVYKTKALVSSLRKSIRENDNAETDRLSLSIVHSTQFLRDEIDTFILEINNFPVEPQTRH